MTAELITILIAMGVLTVTVLTLRYHVRRYDVLHRRFLRPDRESPDERR